MLRQQAADRLQAIQTQMYQLSEEDKSLTSFLSLAAQEDQERYQLEQQKAAEQPEGDKA